MTLWRIESRPRLPPLGARILTICTGKSIRLYLVIGRMTFSAGVNFVTDAEMRTNATLVGEPTGGSPNQYGDAVSFELPNSGLRARISTVYWNKGGTDDEHPHHEPHLWAPVTAADYFAGRDSAWDAIHAHDTPELSETHAPHLRRPK